MGKITWNKASQRWGERRFFDRCVSLDFVAVDRFRHNSIYQVATLSTEFSSNKLVVSDQAADPLLPSPTKSQWWKFKSQQKRPCMIATKCCRCLRWVWLTFAFFTHARPLSHFLRFLSFVGRARVAAFSSAICMSSRFTTVLIHLQLSKTHFLRIFPLSCAFSLIWRGDF